MEQKLPPEWEVIPDQCLTAKDIVKRCYALTQKPRKELTDEDRAQCWNDTYEVACWTADDVNFAKAIEAAVWAKQREPETVTFRAYRYINGEVRMARSDVNMVDNCEWLDHDGKPQTFEVKV